MPGKAHFRPNATCPAMEEAGITDPESQAGIDFCIDHCPYDHCVIAEPQVASSTVKAIAKRRLARKLYEQGRTVGDIAQILSTKAVTIREYLA